MLHKAHVALTVLAVASAISAIAGCGSAPAGGVARGEQVYRTCVPCHGADGQGDLALRAPSIAGLPEWYLAAQLTKFKSDIRGAHPDDMEGHRMRPMARTLNRPGDLEAVAAYIAGMPAGWIAPAYHGGDVEAGRATYEGLCTACHGPDARGIKDMGAPPLTGQADWYMVAQLRKFQSGMRGTHPEDITGQQMRAMSLTMPDSAALHGVVAYVKSLPH